MSLWRVCDVHGWESSLNSVGWFRESVRMFGCVAGPGRDLDGCAFNGARMAGVDLRWSSLVGASFRGADLQGTSHIAHSIAHSTAQHSIA